MHEAAALTWHACASSLSLQAACKWSGFDCTRAEQLRLLFAVIMCAYAVQIVGQIHWTESHCHLLLKSMSLQARISCNP